MATTSTYTLLQRITLTTSATSVTFSSIPQSGYTDLKIVFSARTDRSGAVVDNVKINVNGDGYGTNITNISLLGDGTSTASYNSLPVFAGGLAPGSTATSNVFNSNELYFPNYNSSTATKTFLTDSVTENLGTSAFQIIGSTLYSSNSPITSIALAPDVGTNFVANSTFSLYGISSLGTKPGTPKALGGDIIRTDGTYWYHAFLNSGAFTPSASLSCTALVIAGGGAGGSGGGGGGGAGGYRSDTLSLTAQSYPVVIGAGGARLNTNRGYAGTYSSISTITSSGGGGGGGGSTVNGGSGGSGGGAGYQGTVGAGNSGSYSPVEGYAGGNMVTDNATYTNSGGGGGATAAGANATTGTNGGGAGGAGSNSFSTWATATSTGSSGYYAGGGGGAAQKSGSNAGAGGAGGGGAGSFTGSNAVDGLGNTGSGGGGSAQTSNLSGNGGSGIVIIRYAV